MALKSIFSHKPFWIGALLLVIVAGSAGIALAGRLQQEDFDYWVLYNVDRCSDAIDYSGAYGSVIEGEEAHILDTGDFGDEQFEEGFAAAPGTSSASVVVQHSVCLTDRSIPYTVTYALAGGGSDGYIVGYELDIRADGAEDPIDHDDDTIGGGEAGCLEIDGELAGEAAALPNSPYYYGMQIYADGSVNSNFCAEDGLAYASVTYTVNGPAAPEATATPITYSPLETPIPPTPVECEDGYRPEGAHCVPDNFLTPTPGARLMSPESPDMPCNGAELLTAAEFLAPGESWTRMQHIPYEFYNVRFGVAIDVGEMEYANLVAGASAGAVIFGDTIHEGYYAAAMPAPPLSNPGGGDALIEIENDEISASTMVVVSICVMDIPQEDLCINPDPYLEDPLMWTTTGDVTYNAYGGITLDPAAYVYQVWPTLDAGNYELSVDAAAGLPDTIMEINYNEVGGAVFQIALPGGPSGGEWYWNRYAWNFTVEDGDGERPIGAGHVDTGGGGLGLFIYRICLKTLADSPTPTPTATPTPQPPAPTPGSICYNSDPSFDLPGMWQLISATIDDSVLTFAKSAPASRVARNTSNEIPAGHYQVVVSARAPNIPANCDYQNLYVNLFGESGLDSMNEFILNEDEQWHVYVASLDVAEDIDRIDVVGNCGMTGMSIDYPPIAGTFMQSGFVCISSLVGPGTPTPTPSPTPTTPPGMTATPTPEYPPPDGCLNYDSGLDGIDDEWTALGGAEIADSQATMPPGSRLVAEISSDNSHSYYVHITMRCNAYAPAYLSWRNKTQATACDTSGLAEYTFLFTPPDATGAMAASLTDLLDDTWAPQVLISPLEGPAGPTSGGEHPWNILLNSDVFEFEVDAASPSWITVASICIKDAGWSQPLPTPPPGGGGGDPTSVEIRHPVCERDYSIQRSYTDNIFSHFYGMLIGPGRKPGMPVHAIGGGVVVNYGETLSYILGDDPNTSTYAGCVLVDHSEVFNANVQSLYCNLNQFAIPASLRVERGALLGYTSDYIGDNGIRGDGLLAFALQVNGEWDNPAMYFEGYPDCRSYTVVAEIYETCDAEGSDLIPARFNPETPAFWEVGEYIPWLAKKLYDWVGYPILCALVPLFNLIVTTLVSFANAVINALSAPLIFIYRIGRVFEYLLYVLDRVLAELQAMLDAFSFATLCFRTIIVYFIGAMRAATGASVAISVPAEGSPFAFAVSLSMALISNTVANIFMLPLTALFIGYSSWKLIPWGIRTILKAVFESDMNS
jgi:hypothetical protein